MSESDIAEQVSSFIRRRYALDDQDEKREPRFSILPSDNAEDLPTLVDEDAESRPPFSDMEDPAIRQIAERVAEAVNKALQASLPALIEQAIIRACRDQSLSILRGRKDDAAPLPTLPEDRS